MPASDQIAPSALRAWEQRVAGAVQVRQPSDVQRIAEACATAEFYGERFVNVWHEAARFYGTKCHCRQCEAAR